MTVFRIPDDFPLISQALASPLLQAGDTILVKETAGHEVVVVPSDKPGIRIVTEECGVIPDGGEDTDFVPAAGEGSAVSADPGDDVGLDTAGSNVWATEAADDPLTGVRLEGGSGGPEENRITDESGSVASIPPEAAGDSGGPDDPPGSAALWLEEAGDDAAEPSARSATDPDGFLETRPEERKAVVTLFKAGAGMIRPGRRSGASSWGIVHRHR